MRYPSPAILLRRNGVVVVLRLILRRTRSIGGRGGFAAGPRSTRALQGGSSLDSVQEAGGANPVLEAQVSMSMLAKQLDSQKTAAAALLQAMPQSGQAAAGGHLFGMYM